MSNKGKASRAAVWVILALLIVGLAGFGATNFGGSVRSIGQVGDTEISVDRYARALNDELSALTAQTGQPFNLSQAQAFGLDRAVLERLVATVALEHEASRIGISVGDEQVGAYLRDIPAFQGLDGSFDRDAYQFALERTGMSIGEFEESLRAEVARTMLQGAAVSGTGAPVAYVDTLLDFVAETRDATWIEFGPSALETPVGLPGEADLQAYYEANPQAFTRPETREITYVWVTPDMMLDSIEVDEADLRALYDDRIAEYVTPERRLVERLVFRTEDQAAAAKARIDAGEITFDELVEERELTLDDIDLGDVTEADLGDAGAAVFALDGPGVAGPAPSSLGPALFRMNAILSAQESSFEEVREDLRSEFAADRARRAISDRIEDLDDLLAAGATLEELADETEMELGTLDWTDGSDEGPAAYSNFRRVASTVEPDDFPELFELEDGGLFALRLEAVRAPELQPLDAVRDAAIAGWQADETTARLADYARSIAGQLEGGASFAELELAPTGETGLRRNGFVEDVPDGFVARLFEMEPGGFDVLAADGRAVVIRLDAVNAPDPDAPDVALQRARISEAASQAIGQDLLEAFTRAIENQSGITLNQQAINAVHRAPRAGTRSSMPGWPPISTRRCR
jgi:peptidyl-prolyl cis-trans isomerase D